ncbi:MAG: ABC transporter ATP-binding protein [Legionellales bacterium]|nr:ABC transporter ATP-binding protein [Legionellales bacterium]
MSAITVTHLSKAYKHYPSLAKRLAEWMLGGYKTYHTLHWILNDIHFSVNPGEAVGIVGMNGMGKSTLLKIITGTSHPTTGSVSTKGRVSALLELGVGFHPEFTGRQNVFITGQLMGYSNKEIQALIPGIESFAEIGNYMDRPIRVYSSGMKMRLAFSIATIAKPDVLIIDEALSVGDGYFQHKCFKRIRELLDQGCALLFVSHDSFAVSAICDKALLLHKGSIVMQGKPETVMNEYKSLLANAGGTHPLPNQTPSGTGEAKVVGIHLYNDIDELVTLIHVGDKVRLHILVEAYADLSELTLGYEIKDVFGQPIFGTNTYHLKHQVTHITNGEILEFNLQFIANLGMGSYSISVALHTSYDHLEKNYEWRDLAFTFDVANVSKPAFLGVAWLPPLVKCTRASESSQKRLPIEVE